MEATQDLQGGCVGAQVDRTLSPVPIPALTRAALILMVSFIEVLNVPLEQIKGIHDKKTLLATTG